MIRLHDVFIPGLSLAYPSLEDCDVMHVIWMTISAARTCFTLDLIVMECGVDTVIICC